MQDRQTYIREKIVAGESRKINAKSGFRESFHSFDENVADAIYTAAYLNRPLLIKGDPGLGKSQVAHALAVFLGWNLVTKVVHSHTQPMDLLYRIDHVKRLAKAQVLGTLANANAIEEKKPSATQLLTQLDEQRFVVPGPLWWAYDFESVLKFYQQPDCDFAFEKPADWHTGVPSVLLIDEIDKADSELPNALLEVLNNHSFHEPVSNALISPAHQSQPFVVITSNDEKPLPHAFLRRCVVLELELPEGEEGIDYLHNIAAIHSERLAPLNNGLIRQAAKYVLDQRKGANDGDYKAGTSEFLDMLQAISEPHYPDEGSQEKALDMVSQFLLNKQKN